MLVAVAGTQGSGKSLTMSILGTYFSHVLKCPLYDNYSLRNSQKIYKISELWDINKAIVCLDELWLTMDSRMWKDSTVLTRWINQCRKKGLIVFYTTQHMSQIDVRVRNATDYLVFAEKKGDDIWIKFVDYQYGILHKQFLISDPFKFYNLYDTYQVLQPLLLN